MICNETRAETDRRVDGSQGGAAVQPPKHGDKNIAGPSDA